MPGCGEAPTLLALSTCGSCSRIHQPIAQRTESFIPLVPTAAPISIKSSRLHCPPSPAGSACAPASGLARRAGIRSPFPPASARLMSSAPLRWDRPRPIDTHQAPRVDAGSAPGLGSGPGPANSAGPQCSPAKTSVLKGSSSAWMRSRIAWTRPMPSMTCSHSQRPVPIPGCCSASWFEV